MSDDVFSISDDNVGDEDSLLMDGGTDINEVDRVADKLSRLGPSIPPLFNEIFVTRLKGKVYKPPIPKDRRRLFIGLPGDWWQEAWHCAAISILSKYRRRQAERAPYSDCEFITCITVSRDSKGRLKDAGKTKSIMEFFRTNNTAFMLVDMKYLNEAQDRAKPPLNIPFENLNKATLEKFWGEQSNQPLSIDETGAIRGSSLFVVETSSKRQKNFFDDNVIDYHIAATVLMNYVEYFGKVLVQKILSFGMNRKDDLQMPENVTSESSTQIPPSEVQFEAEDRLLELRKVINTSVSNYHAKHGWPERCMIFHWRKTWQYTQHNGNKTIFEQVKRLAHQKKTCLVILSAMDISFAADEFSSLSEEDKQTVFYLFVKPPDQTAYGTTLSMAARTLFWAMVARLCQEPVDRDATMPRPWYPIYGGISGMIGGRSASLDVAVMVGMRCLSWEEPGFGIDAPEKKKPATTTKKTSSGSSSNSKGELGESKSVELSNGGVVEFHLEAKLGNDHRYDYYLEETGTSSSFSDIKGKAKNDENNNSNRDVDPGEEPFDGNEGGIITVGESNADDDFSEPRGRPEKGKNPAEPDPGPTSQPQSRKRAPPKKTKGGARSGSRGKKAAKTAADKNPNKPEIVELIRTNDPVPDVGPFDKLWPHSQGVQQLRLLNQHQLMHVSSLNIGTLTVAKLGSGSQSVALRDYELLDERDVRLHHFLDWNNFFLEEMPVFSLGRAAHPKFAWWLVSTKRGQLEHEKAGIKAQWLDKFQTLAIDLAKKVEEEVRKREKKNKVVELEISEKRTIERQVLEENESLSAEAVMDELSKVTIDETWHWEARDPADQDENEAIEGLLDLEDEKEAIERLLALSDV